MKSPQEWKNILLENLPDPVVRLQVILDEEGQPADYKFLEVNAALEKNMGISRNGLAGKTVTEIFPQLDNSGFDWVGTLNQVYYSGEHIQFVYYFHLTGSYFDITAYSENGSFITTIFRDITEEKKKEKLAYESRQFTQSVLDSSSAHICVIDEDGFIEAVNRPWDKFAADNEGNLEKTGEGINYLEVCETVQGEEREDALKFASAIRSIIRGEKDYFEMEYPCHSPHEERWFIAAITPFEDNNSLPRKVVITHTNITPHKEIEKILAEHGEQYRLLVENLQEGIWYIDAGGYTKYVNQAMAEMLGYTISEMRGKHLFEFLNEEERKKTEVSLKRRKQGVKEIDERKFTHKEGFQIITRLSTSPLFDDKGNYMGSIAAVQDITEQKQMERNLQESEEKFRLMAESSPLAIMMYQNDYWVYVNPAAAQITGYSIDELYNMHFWELIHPNYKESVTNIGKKRQEGFDEKTAYEFKIITKQGQEKWLYLSGATVNYQGAPAGMINCMDITESKQIREKLQENEQFLRTIFENLNEIISITDLEGNYKYLGSSHRILGYSFEELYGENVMKFVHPEDYPRVIEKFNRFITDPNYESSPQEEYRYRCADGSYMWLETVGQFILDDEGRPQEILFSSRDITDRKQIEKELQESEEKFRLLAESSPLAVMMYQNDYWVYVNPAAEQFFVYSAEDFYSMRFWDFVHPDYKEIAKSRGKNRQAGINDTTPYEFKVLTKQGLEKWIFLSGSTVSYQGAPAGMINCMDITESKQAKYELQRAYALLEREINKASSIHEKILPQKIPQPQNISIAAHFQPAEIMGGDFYNVIHRDGKLIFYLSDVSGHGLDGAMISAFIKEAIESYVKLKPDEIMPGRIIEHVSEQYYRETYPDEQLICIFVGVIDLESMELRYSSAGFQTYPLVRWGTGEREKLKTSGLFISNMVPYEFLNFEESSIYIDDGTTIMFSTDGLFEQKNGEEWFYQYIEDIFYRHSHLTPEIIVQDVNKEFCFFNNNSLVGEDDITFLVFQVGSHSNQQKNYSFKIPSDLEELKPLYEEVSDILSGYEEKENFLNCMHELVANAMEHGNQFEPNKEVAINITLAPQFIAAEVEDEGEGFNWCEKINKPLDIEDFTERGRGIPLLCLLSCNLFYNAKGNRATMVIE